MVNTLTPSIHWPRGRGHGRSVPFGVGRRLSSLLLALLLQPLAGAVLAAETWNQGVYIWNSKALLDPGRLDGELDRLQQAGLRELMLGLTGAQVRAGELTRRRLRLVLKRAHARGQTVLLLLGDPAWITAASRSELLDLIRLYRDLPFDGVHLDLEVEQLGWPVPPQRLREWLLTLEAVRQASPWPVSFSSHPRWFEGLRSGSPCVPCALNANQRVSLMIYQRNPQTSAARISAIARRWPLLRFRLAQSVEPGLEPGLSWSGASASQLRDQVAVWRRTLLPLGIGGIDWQDWSSFPRGAQP